MSQLTPLWDQDTSRSHTPHGAVDKFAEFSGMFWILGGFWRDRASRSTRLVAKVGARSVKVPVFSLVLVILMV